MISTANEALGRSQIEAVLSGPALASLSALTILPETDSSNSALSRLPPGEQHRHAVFAELQTCGRGRRARSWHSPAGGNIYLSLGWQFEADRQPLATLPLAVAVCVSRALALTGLAGHGIKWPNDILVEGRKLAGILVEMQSSGGGPARAIIGVGLNVHMVRNEETGQAIDQPWTDLANQLPAGMHLNRNLIAGQLLDSLLVGMQSFATHGFGAFQNDWRARDLLNGKPVRLDHDGEAFTGTMRGIDDSGAVLIESPGGAIKAWHSGEVSIRHV